MTETRYLDVPALATRWKRSEEWVRTAARSKAIPATKIGYQWRFDLDEVVAFEDRNRRRDPLALTPGAAARRRARRT